ncbi:MAG TPA: DUF3047 domain-containing protein [Casimicrobiaceae bacterium]
MRFFACALCCAAFAAGALAQAVPEIPRFSGGKAGGALPAEWKQVSLASFKNNTDYALVVEDGAVVLRATAHNAASVLAARADFDPHQFPMLSWRWKVAQGIAAANTAEQSKEDAPARLMVAFAGDMSKLPFKERATASAAQSISGQALPYATLMYVWGSKVAIDSITTSSRSSRVRMLAVATDDQGIGRWQSYARNLAEDFKRAFGEEPGKVTSIQVMTDTDNTGADAQAYYGDITVGPAKP